MSIKFWKWLRKYAGKQILEKEGGCQCKCPNCDTWSALMYDGPHGLDWHTGELNFDQMSCGKCAYISVWEQTGMIPIYNNIETLKLHIDHNMGRPR